MKNYQKIFAKREQDAFLSQYILSLLMIKKFDSPTDICNAFNSFFADVGKTLAAGIKLTGKIKSQKNYLDPRQRSSIFLNPTDEFEVLEEIQNLSFQKFPGYIDIPVDVFEHSKFVIASYISKFI